MEVAMKYYDVENNALITREDLRRDFQELKTAGETEIENFSDYVDECTGKNGTLIDLPETDNRFSGVTYGNWIETNHGFTECVGFYRDGSGMWIIPDDVESFRILDITFNSGRNTAYIRFDVER